MGQQINTNQKTVSTLLIPSHYILYFKRKCKKHCSKSLYFQYLLKNTGATIKSCKKKIKKKNDDQWKTSYQQKNTGFVRCSFRPDPALWEQLRNTACGFGVSMCFLFVFLMELEMSGNTRLNEKGCGNCNEYRPKPPLKAVGYVRWIEFYPRRLRRKVILLC